MSLRSARSGTYLVFHRKTVQRLGRWLLASLCMGLTWSLIGCLIGLNTARCADLDAIAKLSMLIAWPIVMAAFGTLFGLLPARPWHVLVVAALGGLLATGVEFGAALEWPGMGANQGLLMGAIVGSTLEPWLRVVALVGRGVCLAFRRPGPSSPSSTASCSAANSVS